MNYLTELNAFNNWREQHYLPKEAQFLWYKLMAKNNRLAWCEWFQLPNVELMAILQIKREETAVDIRNKLVDAGLIEFEKGKKGSPNRCKIISLSKVKVQTAVNIVADSVAEPEVQTVNNNKQDKIKQEIGFDYPIKSNQLPISPISIDEIEEYRNIIHENIEYDISVLNNPADKCYIDNIVEVMLECMTAKSSVRIGNNEYSPEVVKSRLLKIDSSHIEYLLHCLNKHSGKVKNIKAYLRAMIFNAPSTLDTYYRAEVNHDFKDMR
jgi:hypothetical protein